MKLIDLYEIFPEILKKNSLFFYLIFFTVFSAQASAELSTGMNCFNTLTTLEDETLSETTEFGLINFINGYFTGINDLNADNKAMRFKLFSENFILEFTKNYCRSNPDDDWLKIANKLINKAEIDYSPPINK